ncbi:MAG: glycosidase [Desulfobacterales bacterium]|nr:glycosidase [Desulfobacterales bacterium]
MISVRRLNIKFYPDPKRVIARFFMPGAEKARSIVDKVIQLSEDKVHSILTHVFEDFSERHRKMSAIFQNHHDQIQTILEQELSFEPGDISTEKMLLIGSYFTMEYSIESAAIFNPSIVEDPNQEFLEEGERRVIVSFRATGEGHISSIVFRSGILTKENELIFKPVDQLVEIPEKIKRHVYTKDHFIERIWLVLIERRSGLEYKDAYNKIINSLMGELEGKFIYGKLLGAIERYTEGRDLSFQERRVIDALERVADSHYEMEFSLDTALSERVIFPFSMMENKGVEDVRIVRFTEDDGAVTYYSTYTAYSEHGILPKFISTKDFRHFTVKPINGEYARNKGMALFPRRIKGRYVMLARLDGASHYVLFSDSINVWSTDAKKILGPEHPWEFIQVGNCGSPLETDEGWLVVTHGVGPVRRYCLGAMLLDRHDPTKIIARLQDPLMMPNEEEREGYVPNVVYSCGAIINNGELIIAYGMSDSASSFAAVSLDRLFAKMQKT